MPSERSSSALVKVDLGDVTRHNINLLKKINEVVLPVIYNLQFYKAVLEYGEFSKLAYYNDIVVGAVCCRVQVTSGQPASRKLYIMTLGCLHPYRRRGIGSKMLRHVLDTVEKEGHFDAITLHVQVNNEGALEFYKKFGFHIVGTKEQYYKRIEPADAHVLEKQLNKERPLNGNREEVQENDNTHNKCEE
ncbi:putative N-acetyltransferase san [Caligus rogercresseyi]|uniref:N-terminal methionine N(alpha)-acetyltransferase NatE n=1 Tax=Caligus rogercresseyi TaxID=217165 RepID=A0A7T8GRA6_CALRO|nr:putative N-acetyltransferase san [Caligus rogercresseyi]QQP36302.1 putative N-acetyltransferase san [Caligus rogercresseyi]|eukprot:TRINITY_DN773_c0_g1_i1.p1 TRINITY_DN773_c0_g1~~TRINITY_DN773_c0_g1_i1.p1  ORF type:complete len:190 (-),score=75.69 TRINITY_DN773_c0_g1_i1:605-1174(-)